MDEAGAERPLDVDRREREVARYRSRKDEKRAGYEPGDNRNRKERFQNASQGSASDGGSVAGSGLPASTGDAYGYRSVTSSR